MSNEVPAPPVSDQPTHISQVSVAEKTLVRFEPALRSLGLALASFSTWCLLKDGILAALTKVTPSADLLTILAGVYGGLIAVVVPLSYTIVNQISERYGSDVVSRRFAQLSTVRNFPLLLLSALSATVVSEFFGVDSHQSVWRVLAWIHLLLFGVVVVWLQSYFMRVLRYMDSEHLLEELLDSNADAFVRVEQNDFLRTTEGIGDVLVYETNRRQDDHVIVALSHLRSMSELMVQKLTNPGEVDFVRFAVSAKFIEVQHSNKGHAAFMAITSPEEVYTCFGTIVNQFDRAAEAAVRVQERAIAGAVMKHLTWVLKALGQQEGGGAVTTLQDIIFDVFRRWFQVSCETKNGLMSQAITSWYRDSVLSNEDFQVTWLKRFNQQLFSSFQIAILHGDTRTHRWLIESVLNQHADWPEVEFGEIGTIIFRVDREVYRSLELELEQVRNLASESRCIFSIEAFEKWQDRLRQRITAIKDAVPPAAKSQLENEVSTLLAACRATLIIQQVRQILFMVGAYCVFKKSLDFVKSIWEAHQPADSQVTWVGADVIPETLEELFTFYFAQMPYERERGIYWEGHHSSDRYQQDYFALLLLKLLVRYRRDGRTLESMSLSDLGLLERHRLRTNAPSIAESLDLLISEPQKLAELGISSRDVADVSEDLLNFFRSVKATTDSLEKLELLAAPVSVDLVEKTLSECVKAYQDKNRAVQLFNQFARLHSYRHGPQTFHDVILSGPFYKEMFVDNWYLPFADIGKQLGQRLASSENTYLADQVAANCTEVDRAEFDETVSHTACGTMILLAGAHALTAISRREDFTYIDAPHSADRFSPSGYISTTDGATILVYRFSFSSRNTAAFIDTRRLGHLGQFDAVGYTNSDFVSLSVEPLAGQEGKIGQIIAQEGLSPEAAEKRREDLQTFVRVVVLRRIRYAKRKAGIGIVADMS